MADTASLIAIEQATISDTADGLASVPSGARAAIVAVETNTLRYRTDGTDPTSTVGFPADAGERFIVNTNLQNLRLIRSSGSDATITVGYFDNSIDPGGFAGRAGSGLQALIDLLPAALGSQGGLITEPQFQLTNSFDAVGTAALSRVVNQAQTPKTVSIVSKQIPASQTDYATGLPAAQGSGIKIVVAWLAAANLSTTTTSSIAFNTKPAGAGTKLWATAVPAEQVRGMARNEDGWFETAANEGLTVTTGGVAIELTFGWFQAT